MFQIVKDKMPISFYIYSGGIEERGGGNYDSWKIRPSSLLGL
jgi:hypothetical protein